MFQLEVPLRDRDQEMPFSFWEWFFSIMTLIKSKLTEFWNEGETKDVCCGGG